MASEVITRKLYAGEVEMVHNPNARGRQPRYLVNGVDKPRGVTTILGGTLSKDLMAWAVACCVEYLKGKMPNISNLDLEDAAHEYERKRDAGASTGSEAHALVEQFLKEQDVDLVGASEEAKNAYAAFLEWWGGLKDTAIVNVEEVVFSRRYQYAGTYDCLLRVNGKNYLCDLKTTNASRKAPEGVYAEYFIQLGAYAAAHEEQRLYELEFLGESNLVEIDGLMVISAKKDGKLHVRTNDDIGLTVAQCGDLFTKVLDISNFLITTTKTLGGK